MPPSDIAFLGPCGTYSHQVAQKRFRTGRLHPFASILDACEYTAARHARRAIVPIENSSRGTIDKTIDILIDDPFGLQIEEELSMQVSLALLGHRDKPIRRVYSHYAPLDHCDPWLRQHHPQAVKCEVSSTAAAAQAAAREPESAAIGSLRSARLYGLDVLVSPIAPELPNVTQFLVLARKPQDLPRARKTSLVVRLADHVGSLCSFLEPFRDREVNLSRIVSRPIIGRLKQYAFFVDIDGTPAHRDVAAALAEARTACESVRIVGAYPCHRTYRS